MQTFTASGGDEPKKPEYKPFLPEDVGDLQNDSLQSTLPRENTLSFDPLLAPQMTPEQSPVFSQPVGMGIPASSAFVPQGGMIPAQDSI